MLVFIFLLTSVVGTQETLGIFKQSTDILLTQVCANCTYNNISYVSYPNMSLIGALSNINMTKSGVTYSYTLISNYTADLGRYIVCGFGDLDGQTTTWCYDFYVNATGRAEPSGSVLVFFIIGFLVIMGFLIYIFIYSFGHFIKKDFDMKDLAINWGLYFVLISFFILQGSYLGNPVMANILEVIVYVGAFTHMICSLIFFCITLIVANMEQYKQKTGGI